MELLKIAKRLIPGFSYSRKSIRSTGLSPKPTPKGALWGLLVLMVLAVGCQAGESGQNITPTPGESAEQASIPKLTPQNYEAIREGMTRQQVEEILGPGEEISTAELEAISGPDREVGSYLWTEDLNLVTIIFEDNRVVTKDKSGF